VTNHIRPHAARPLAELALKNLIVRDVEVLAAREADDEAIWHDEARAKMRERALERAAANRKSKSQPTVSPVTTRRAGHG
jgi:hypothetical protein